MTELIVGTTNEAKILQIRGALAYSGLEIIGVTDWGFLPEVVEDGETAIDNARKKALAYAVALGNTVLSMDNALYIDGLADDEQPRLHVRRVNRNHEAATDDELLSHYLKIISDLGGTAKGHSEFGVCVASPVGILGEKNIKSPDRIFTTKIDSGFVPGYPLDSMQIEPLSGKYFSQMRQSETDEFWQGSIGKELRDFVVSIGLEIKNK